MPSEMRFVATAVWYSLVDLLTLILISICVRVSIGSQQTPAIHGGIVAPYINHSVVVLIAITIIFLKNLLVPYQSQNMSHVLAL